MLARAAGLTARLASQLALTRWIPARNRQGVVSFTFDDIPQSAAGAGAPILEAAGAQGTFYVAGSLIGTPGHATVDDLKRLVAYGHELGCHTFSHAATPSLNGRALAEECRRNQDFISETLGDTRLASFAYPFGAVSPADKFRLQKRFASCRGGARGLNAGLVDVGLLRAEKLYESRTTQARVRALIDAAARRRAWLIFASHDVSDAPSEYGVTPSLLRFALACARDASLEILPIRSALARVAYG